VVIQDPIMEWYKFIYDRLMRMIENIH
jgi:hypothetical protein